MEKQPNINLKFDSQFDEFLVNVLSYCGRIQKAFAAFSLCFIMDV